jgi:formylglycine-generating enzyme required for sulfatase activity
MNLLRRSATSVFVALILISLSTLHARAVTIEMVTVGDAGNSADTTGYGAVPYEYQIGKYEVTIGQYVEFLNAVAKQDTYSLYWASLMSTSDSGGIVQTGSPGSYFYYAIISDYYRPIPQATASNRPIAQLSWWQAARFANWMSNGQPTGAQGVSTTENGAYALNGKVSGTAPAVNAINPTTGLSPSYRLPTENEWYKAAYYKGGGTSAGYWDYATQNDGSPGNIPGSGSNQANYWTGTYSVTQSSNLLGGQNHLTDVGAFSASPSAYGTFDQSGNAWELNDLTGAMSLARGRRGGDWSQNWAEISSFVRYESQGTYGGFRLASPVAVPEPSTWVMAAGGLACGGYTMFRRRLAS